MQFQEDDHTAAGDETTERLRADAQRHSRLTHWLLHHISNYFDQSRTCN